MLTIANLSDNVSATAHEWGIADFLDFFAPQARGWNDGATPRTERPVRFLARFQGATLSIPSLLVPVRRIAR